MTYQVNEIFTSIQGEGMWAGVPATFIRLQGCTVGCPWCDTKYTWKRGGVAMTPEQIQGVIDHDHVVITGGEPTLYNLDNLLEMLAGLDSFVQLETSGQNPLKGVIKPDWITWSPKKNLSFTAAPEILATCDEVKFVVDDAFTEEDVDYVLEQVRGNKYFVFMPEGAPPSQAQRERAMKYVNMYAIEHWVRYSDRLQWILQVR